MIFNSFLTLPISKKYTVITGQYGDKVIYKGKEYIIHDYLMDAYFAKYPDKKPQLKISSSALERGYVATYEITNDKLYLIDIKIRTKSSSEIDSWLSVYDKVFPVNGKKVIDWKNGFLTLPDGKILNKHSSSPKYSGYIIFELKKGEVRELRKYEGNNLGKFKKEQLIAFKKTTKYKSLIKCFKKTRIKPFYKNEDMDFYLRSNILRYTDEFLVK